jgi:hypothetical protein
MVLVFCLPGVCSWAASNETSVEKEKITKSNELEQRGKQLRKAIDEAYKKLEDTHVIKGYGSNSIYDVVVHYIPIGTSFDDAEAILRAAGFKVGPRKQNSLSHDLYEVAAVIEYYVPTSFGRTDIDISLIPESPNNWKTVKDITAVITRQFI